MWSRAVAVGAALLLTSSVTGCRSEYADDCDGRIGFEGVVYRTHSALNPTPVPGRPLGQGDLLDCDGTAYDRDKVFAIRGVDPKLAVLVKARGHVPYVAEGAPRSSWPAALRQHGSNAR